MARNDMKGTFSFPIRNSLKSLLAKWSVTLSYDGIRFAAGYAIVSTTPTDHFGNPLPSSPNVSRPDKGAFQVEMNRYQSPCLVFAYNKFRGSLTETTGNQHYHCSGFRGTK